MLAGGVPCGRRLDNKLFGSWPPVDTDENDFGKTDSALKPRSMLLDRLVWVGPGGELFESQTAYA